MQDLIKFASEHTGLFFALLGSGWFLNSSSSVVVAKLAKCRTSKWWVAVKVLHGFLDKIDPRDEVKS